MKFSLIICTYKRPNPVVRLLDSVQEQRLYPNEILVIDGSPDAITGEVLAKKDHENLIYFRVEEEDRGLTRQRNVGISRVSEDMEIVCFLDDDVVLKPNYFEKLIGTYKNYPDAIGVGGYILNDGIWRKKEDMKEPGEYKYDGWERELGSRNVLRKKLRLLSDVPPGYMPEFANGLSIGFLPPSGKVYPVEFFMGGVASYRKKLFRKIKFSQYFEGYGLYEDMDFCLRASKLGQLYVNTAAQLYHYHETGGRPNKYRYGKMVVRNGWYVWRVRYPAPSVTARFKWHATAFLLTFVRFGNVVTTVKKKEALTESLGRVVGWWSLLFNKPGYEN